MKQNYIVIVLGSFLAFLSLLARPAFAETCTTQYGGTTPCVSTQLTIDKKVRDPINLNVFKENVVDGDTPYAPGATVEYLLTVTNSTNQSYQTVTVKDVLPAELEFTGGPGTYDAGSRTLIFTITNLGAGQTVANRVAAIVKPLATNLTKTCNVVNSVKLLIDSNEVDNDTAALCVKSEVLGATTLPVAGFNDLFLLLPFAGMGLGGLALLKKRG